MQASADAIPTDNEIRSLRALADPPVDQAPYETRIERFDAHASAHPLIQVPPGTVPLFCGSDQPFTSAHFYEYTHGFSSMSLGMSDASPQLRPQKSRKSSGCGAQIHTSALPMSQKVVWTGDVEGVAADVIPLEDKYMPLEAAATMAIPGRDMCGCTCGFVGGNPLGMLFTPCTTHFCSDHPRIYSFLPSAVSPPLPHPHPTSPSPAIWTRTSRAPAPVAPSSFPLPPMQPPGESPSSANWRQTPRVPPPLPPPSLPLPRSQPPAETSARRRRRDVWAFPPPPPPEYAAEYMQVALQIAAMIRQELELAGYVVNDAMFPRPEVEARARESLTNMVANAVNMQPPPGVTLGPGVVLGPVPPENLLIPLRGRTIPSAPASAWEGWERFRMPL
ncbi:hypothetical protein C8R44DRAFT_865181 [Mycena epipterygia]|nr:hypothetical protein C8R44DRAFT_865181 [Mycena epipterygia]